MKNKILCFCLLTALVLLFSGCGGDDKDKEPEVPPQLLPEYPVINDEVTHEFHKWAMTPPMGWNSWDCYGPNVTEDQVKVNARFIANNLLKHGWEYIVVDIRWFVENQTTGYYIGSQYNPGTPVYVLDEWGRYIPSPTRFPSSVGGAGFKPLADSIHELGLKFGIHIMRGIPVKAVQDKMTVKGASGITADQIYSTQQQCSWLNDNWTIDAAKDGAQEYYDSIFELYASWGVDYIKIDDISRPYHSAEIELIRKSIDKTGRPIVLSLSPGETPIGQAAHVKNHANLWRTIDDFWDRWGDVGLLLDKSGQWSQHIGYGHWPDGDMIPLGVLNMTGHNNATVPRLSRLTRDEHYTVMTLLIIMRSPLMFGGDFSYRGEKFDLDYHNFVLSFLTNREAIYISKGSINNRQVYNKDGEIAWIADDKFSNDKFLAILYPGTARPGQGSLGNPYEPTKKSISVNLAELGVNGNVKIRDIWQKKDIGTFSDSADVFAPLIDFHGASLFRLSPME